MLNVPDRPSWRYGNAEAEVLEFHLSMLVDEQRMRSFQDAIAATVRPGDVVVDIGTGTGILSFLACRAGASRVYSAERGPVVELARELSEANGFGDRIVFLPDWSTAIEIPEPADVVVTETIGNAAIDEGIIAWTLDARRRLLRPGGRIVPGRIELWAAAVESWDDYAQVADWSAPALPVDYSIARARAEQTLWSAELAADDLLTAPTLVADVDLHLVQEPGAVEGAGRLRVRRDGVLHGIACWFRSELAPGIMLTNAPPTPAPSWGQGFLAVPRPLDVKAGDILAWDLRVGANGADWAWSIAPADDCSPSS
ncbi:MAG: 50S ribosomal protein L11 methyltransferase [Acidimicrobiia bacterium]|nr:50S ribosomal protein L11 methyltransferase [Acidimicrobiia bacterium]